MTRSATALLTLLALLAALLSIMTWAARRTHNAVLRRTFLSAASPADRQTLLDLWHRLSGSGPGAARP